MRLLRLPSQKSCFAKFKIRKEYRSDIINTNSENFCLAYSTTAFKLMNQNFNFYSNSEQAQKILKLLNGLLVAETTFCFSCTIKKREDAWIENMIITILEIDASLLATPYNITN